jgi:hypothetical protein
VSAEEENGKESGEGKITLEQLKALPKEDMMQLAYDTVAALLDSDAEIVRAAEYNDAELLGVFNKASACHNRIAAAKEKLDNINHQKTTGDVFWMVWTMKLETQMQNAQSEITRLAQTVNTRALLRHNGGMR